MDEYIVFHPDVVSTAAAGIANQANQAILHDMWDFVWNPAKDPEFDSLATEVDRLVAASQGHGQGYTAVAQALFAYREAVGKQLTEIYTVLSDLEQHMTQSGNANSYTDRNASAVGASQPGWEPPTSATQTTSHGRGTGPRAI